MKFNLASVKRFHLTAQNLKGKRVLMRVDLDVSMKPGTKPGTNLIVDDSRLRGAIPSIKHAIDNGASVILMGHWGRPQEKTKDREKLFGAEVHPYLERLIGQKIKLLNVTPDDTNFHRALSDFKESIQPGEIGLIENLRLEPGEEKNSGFFAALLAEGMDLYVNNAPASSHRAHASVVAISEDLPTFAGSKLYDEFEILTMLEEPARPFVAILGGAKVSDKMLVVDQLLQKADYIVIGGAMANTFLAAAGLPVGNSKIEKRYQKGGQDINLIDYAERTLAKGWRKIILPEDAIWANSLKNRRRISEDTFSTTVGDRIAGDIGSKTTQKIIEVIRQGKTIFWNGPLGAFENTAFARGTNTIVHEIVRHTAEGGVLSVIGGGHTSVAIKNAGIPVGLDLVIFYELIRAKLLNILTGGGASLEAIAKGIENLPGAIAVMEKGN